MHRGLRASSKGSTSDLGVGYLSKQYDGKIAGLYDLEETLGRGHFAVVKLARHVFTGEKVAVKVIDKSKLDEVSRAHLFQEVRCMKLVQHPNVVRLYEAIDTATKLYLVLELGDGGDLYEYIMRHETGLPEEVAKEYFSQIVRAISYCHQLHVVHRDLKPENVVFFKKQGIVKLTDFGFSNKFYPGQKLETSCGSLAYSAPEILLGDSYDAPAVDVWSLGVILYMLVCGQAPFQEANDSETLTMIMDCKYDIPAHVSQNCRQLISRMLLRNPEKRATLEEISKHPWLSGSKHDSTDFTPLVLKEQLSEDDHNFILQKIVNGDIATKEEVHESLDKNEYNHITATYYLLAERKLRYKRQEHVNRSKRPEELAVFPNAQVSKNDNSTSIITPSLLNVPRTPGDIPQRSRKCSIVQEDEEEEDISSCSGRDDLGPPLNRRGSRSEGRLNLTIQERIAESEKRRPIVEQKQVSSAKKSPCCRVSRNGKFKIFKVTKLDLPPPEPIITTSIDEKLVKEEDDLCPPINKTLLNSDRSKTPDITRSFISESRKSRFNKNRTASCSSSDASDDDSEKRKKRAQKLTGTPSKSFEVRRDSHDDSSDSQEPGTGVGSSGSGFATLKGGGTFCSNRGTDPQKCKDKNGTYKNERNHRKKTCKTRLRESQSLNRITEVQEDQSHQQQQAVVVSTTILTLPSSFAPKMKSVGAKLLQGFNRSTKKPPDDKEDFRISRRDLQTKNLYSNNQFDKVDSCNKVEKCNVRKIRMFGKYFHVHKKLCIPLAGLFRKNGLYKAQSCSNLSKDRIFVNRGMGVIRKDGDINQNEPVKTFKSSAPAKSSFDMNNMRNELNEICAVHVHIGHACKCSFC
nr:SNF-related serine/threonine-protein kinase [Leptinotarsa decemlineata]